MQIACWIAATYIHNRLLYTCKQEYYSSSTKIFFRFRHYFPETPGAVGIIWEITTK